MLNELSIKNLAIIDDITIKFHEGFNVLTGETGAGKSIIIDALSLVFGARINGNVIAPNKEMARISVSLDLDKAKIKYIYDNFDIDVSNECIITRIITSNNKSTSKINGEIVPLSTISKISEILIDISSQNEKTYLFLKKNHLTLLDNYIKASIPHFKDEYDSSYNEYQQIENEYNELLNNSYDEGQIEYLRYKYNELKDYNFTKDDEENLKNEYKMVNEIIKNQEKISHINYLLSDDNQGINNKLYEVIQNIGHLSTSKANEYYEKFNSLYLDLDDLASSFKKDFNNDDINLKSLDEIEDKITYINRLKRKYNSDDLLALKDDLKKQLDNIENKEIYLSTLAKKLEKAKKDVIDKGNKLQKIREEYGKKLALDVENELKDLYLDNSIFIIKYNNDIHIEKNGLYDAEFYLSTNVGMPPMPLIKVASGGEMSRLMLGLKCVFTRLSLVDTIIFDEIDTGVAGKVAQAIGRKMEKIATFTQVLAITHLPSVAALSSFHYFIEKKVIDNKTVTFVTELNPQEKELEVARLLSGNQLKDSYILAARELIKEKGN